MKNKVIIKSFVVLCAAFFFLSENLYAFWLWTPGTKKFVNPKYAVKDSPREQFEWAMKFYDAKDYPRAIAEFEKLIKHYEFSEEASEAQYYAGLSNENMCKYYLAFQAYQKVVDNYPHSVRLEEIIEREYKIGNIYLTKAGPKLMGSDIMAPLDRAIEIFKKVVENAPYGNYAASAQYRLGLAYKKAELYEEAVMSFQRIVEEYPSSPLVEKARYQVASSAYHASLKPAYDSAATEKAIGTFKEFVDTNQDKALAKEADATLKRLVDNLAEKSLGIAKFYEKQKHYASAIMYYREILEKYPDSSYAQEAHMKIEMLKKRLEKKR